MKNDLTIKPFIQDAPNRVCYIKKIKKIKNI